MGKTVVGLYDNAADAQRALQELTNSGIARDKISLIAADANGEYQRQVGDGSNVVEGAGAGALSGGAFGGVLGLLVGIGALAIPGIGPVIAAGPLAAALGTAGATAAVGAGIGAATGGVLGALVGIGIPEEDAHVYAEGVRRGGTLVTVSADDASANKVYSILKNSGAVDIDTRGSEWREGGWNRFDPQDNAWERSNKVGTSAGMAAGAATGAALGSVAGPVGTVVGGVTGAAIGGAAGAGADVVGQNVDPQPRNEWDNSSKTGTAVGGVAGAAAGAVLGSVAGPIGTVAGGIAGAAAGGGLGAEADIKEDDDEEKRRKDQS